MLALAKGVIAKPRSRPYRSGGVKRSQDEKGAQRIVREGMERHGLSAEE